MARPPNPIECTTAKRAAGVIELLDGDETAEQAFCRIDRLRHTCASLLVAKNINMKIIQVWLGHSNMSTTADIYSHLDANAKSEASKAIESVLSTNTEDTE